MPLLVIDKLLPWTTTSDCHTFQSSNMVGNHFSSLFLDTFHTYMHSRRIVLILLYSYSFFSGNDGSTSIGAIPVINEMIYPPNIEIVPQDKPKTTPASTIFRHGYGNRFTAATITATPIDTLQLTIIRFLVAWNNPME